METPSPTQSIDNTVLLRNDSQNPAISGQGPTSPSCLSFQIASSPRSVSYLMWVSVMPDDLSPGSLAGAIRNDFGGPDKKIREHIGIGISPYVSKKGGWLGSRYNPNVMQYTLH